MWQAIRDLTAECAAASLRRGVSVIHDNTNFRLAHRDALRTAAAQSGAQAIVVHVDTPLAVIAERRAKNALAPERCEIDDADLAFVRERWQEPQPDECAIKFRPGMALEAWLDLLAADVRALAKT